ncbi:MAG: hypothetical protein EP338_02335 [Bacteroidetes bacterium]|nr:MAG: hypothetical protein EP338_02335 [Bacteroidota bacterium]
MKLAEKIPLLYHRFLDDLIGITVPEEEIARCSSCGLCQHPKSPYQETKCCNYQPFQANFLVGAILSDSSDQMKTGKRLTEELIQQRKGLTAFGLIPDRKYQQNQHQILTLPKSFHNQEEIISQRCSFLHEGHCSIWAYREHLCITYFCSSVGASTGQQFWSELNEMMKHIEYQLAQHFAQKLGITWPENFTEAFYEDHFELSDIEHWGPWHGKEDAFFKECFTLLQELDQKNFQEICFGKSESSLEELKQLALNFEQAAFPKFLRLDENIRFENANPGNIKLCLNSREATVPALILPFLRKFDGTQTTSDLFQLAYTVLYDLNAHVEELLEKKMLLNCYAPDQ